VAGILRGDVRWADLDPVRGHEQRGQRPVLILSHDVFNERAGLVIAMAITSQPQRAGFRSHSRLPASRCQALLGEDWPGAHAVDGADRQANWPRVAEEIARAVEGLAEIVG